MTRIELLEQLREFTRESTSELIMPTAPQKTDPTPQPRAADVFLTRLPDSRTATSKAPYILHQIMTGKDIQPEGQRASASTVVRSIFCIYNDDEQEGGLMLLNLMERFRISLLRKIVIGRQFSLDLGAGLEIMIYPDDTAPFFVGEIVSSWVLPAVEREVIL